MNNLLKKYRSEVIPALKKDFGYKNILAVPRIVKVVLNVGVGHGLKDKDYIENVKNTLVRISGQKPIETKARKAISNFKIREGLVVGLKVTLRNDKMWDFLEKLINVTLPRLRDFHGISDKAFDNQGNYSLGLKECISFPEMRQDDIERAHGMEILVTTTAKDPVEGRALLAKLGFPFKSPEENK